MKKLHFLLGVTMCVFLFVPEIHGQAQPAASSEGWRFQVIPYLWGSDFKGRVGIGDRTADVDASFADIFKELNFAFMGTFQATRDRFVTLADIMYLNLSDERATPGPLFSNADAIQRSFILSPEAGYRIVGSESAFVDVLGGIRFWHVNGELKLGQGLLPAVDVEGSKNWVDGIFGLRGRASLSPTWHISGYGDIGGGGSNLTYQVLGVAGADIGQRYAVVFGYRYLNLNYNKDRFLFDNGMGGPVFGFVIKL